MKTLRTSSIGRPVAIVISRRTLSLALGLLLLGAPWIADTSASDAIGQESAQASESDGVSRSVYVESALSRIDLELDEGTVNSLSGLLDTQLIRSAFYDAMAEIHGRHWRWSESENQIAEAWGFFAEGYVNRVADTFMAAANSANQSPEEECAEDCRDEFECDSNLSTAAGVGGAVATEIMMGAASSNIYTAAGGLAAALLACPAVELLGCWMGCSGVGGGSNTPGVHCPGIDICVEGLECDDSDEWQNGGESSGSCWFEEDPKRPGVCCTPVYNFPY